MGHRIGIEWVIVIRPRKAASSEAALVSFRFDFEAMQVT